MARAVGTDFLVEEPSELRRILRSARAIAVVGASTNPGRASNSVMRVLLGRSYEVYPVNPHVTEVLGRRAYANLADIPHPVDIVDVFRRTEAVAQHATEAIAAGAKVLWLQDGIIDIESARRAHEAGLTVVMDHCLARELAQLDVEPRATPS
jgi:hypothetical protein